MTMVFTIIGAAVALWFAAGLCWFMFGMRVMVPPKPWAPPLGAKIMSVLAVSFHTPWIFITTGSLPSAMALTPCDLSPAEAKKFEAWMRANCPCDFCVEQRGNK
jgi:hypothetical protein